MKRLPIWGLAGILFVVQYLLAAAHVGFRQVGLDQALVPTITFLCVVSIGLFSNSKDLGGLVGWRLRNKRVVSWWLLNCLLVLVLMVWRFQSGDLPYISAILMFILFVTLIGGGLSIGVWVHERISSLLLTAWARIRRTFSVDASSPPK
jgi:hypothetical protein